MKNFVLLAIILLLGLSISAHGIEESQSPKGITSSMPSV